MSTFAVVALAGIGDHLPDVVLSRSITLRLDRANNGEVSPSDWRRIEASAHQLRDALADWAEANAHNIATVLATMNTPEGATRSRSRSVGTDLHHRASSR